MPKVMISWFKFRPTFPCHPRAGGDDKDFAFSAMETVLRAEKTPISGTRPDPAHSSTAMRGDVNSQYLFQTLCQKRQQNAAYDLICAADP